MSPLAGRILYTQFAADTQRGTLWSVRDDGSDARPVVTAPEGRQITAVAVATNGAQLAYIDQVAVIGTGERTSDRQLHLANADGRNDRIVLADAEDVSTFAFAPDRALLLVSQFRSFTETMGGEQSLWTLAVRDGALKQVVDWSATVGEPLWLDATHIAYTEAPTYAEVGDIVQRDVRTDGPPTMLAQGRLVARSPDGRALLVALERIGHDIAVTQRFRYGVVALNGNAAQRTHEWRLTVGQFAFSPDGSQLAHLDLAGTISVLHLADSTSEALISFGRKEAMVSGFGWDRTGGALLYSISTSGPNRATELRRLDVLTRSEQVVARVLGDSSLQLVAAPGL